MIIVWTGLPGSGKTTKLGAVAEKILKRNRRYFKKTGNRRVLYSNVRFSERIEQIMGVIEKIEFPEKDFSKPEYSNEGFIYYFRDLDDLVKAREADILWQEMSIYCDAQEWEKSTTDFKWWLRLHRHYGVDIYGDTQDFHTIDVSVRRITNRLYRLIKVMGSRDKSATRPRIKYIWGFSLILKVDPTSFNDEKEEYKYKGLARPFWINKKRCEVFNSYEHLSYDKYPPLKHIVRFCSDKDCPLYGKKPHVLHK